MSISLINQLLLLFVSFLFFRQQFYHHCANIIIDGKADGKLPQVEMTVVDVKTRNVNAKGDGREGKSTGPDPTEEKQSTDGKFYSHDGKAGRKGIDLGLIIR